MERHADARHTEGARDIPAVVSGDDGIAIKNGKKRSVQTEERNEIEGRTGKNTEAD